MSGIRGRQFLVGYHEVAASLYYDILYILAIVEIAHIGVDVKDGPVLTLTAALVGVRDFLAAPHELLNLEDFARTHVIPNT